MEIYSKENKIFTIDMDIIEKSKLLKFLYKIKKNERIKLNLFDNYLIDNYIRFYNYYKTNKEEIDNVFNNEFFNDKNYNQMEGLMSLTLYLNADHLYKTTGYYFAKKIQNDNIRDLDIFLDNCKYEKELMIKN